MIGAMKRYENGEKVAEICRKLGASQASFYTWKKQYASMGVQELRELRQLRDENSRLKRLVADLSLDRQILPKIVSNSSKASPTMPPGEEDARGISDRSAVFGTTAARALGHTAV
jgi:putative transposase